jgi:hypothetical protein
VADLGEGAAPCPLLFLREDWALLRPNGRNTAFKGCCEPRNGLTVSSSERRPCHRNIRRNRALATKLAAPRHHASGLNQNTTRWSAAS